MATDYEALARQFGGSAASPPASKDPVAYEELARQFGGSVVDSAAAAAPAAAPVKPAAPAGPSFFDRVKASIFPDGSLGSTSDGMTDAAQQVSPPGVEAPAAMAAPRPAPAPFRDKREAIDDAVDRIEMGQDAGKVFAHFQTMGISQDEIVARGASLGGKAFAPEARPVTVRPGARDGEVKNLRSTDTGNVRRAADVALAGLGGVNTGFKMLADSMGVNREVSRGLKAAGNYIEGMRSAAAAGDDDLVSDIMSEARDKGAWAQVEAAAKAASVAPASLIAQGLGTSVPAILTALLPGARESTLLRLSAMAATGAGMGAGSVKSSIFDSVTDDLMSTGMARAEAQDRALAAQTYLGKNTDQIAIGAALGALASSTGVERIGLGSVRRLLGKDAVDELGGLAQQGLLRRAAGGVATEAPTEFLQGGQEQLAQNLASQREGFDTPTMRGVVGGATLEALAGAGAGGSIAALAGPVVADNSRAAILARAMDQGEFAPQNIFANLNPNLAAVTAATRVEAQPTTPLTAEQIMAAPVPRAEVPPANERIDVNSTDSIFAALGIGGQPAAGGAAAGGVQGSPAAVGGARDADLAGAGLAAGGDQRGAASPAGSAAPAAVAGQTNQPGAVGFGTTIDGYGQTNTTVQGSGLRDVAAQPGAGLPAAADYAARVQGIVQRFTADAQSNPSRLGSLPTDLRPVQDVNRVASFDAIAGAVGELLGVPPAVLVESGDKFDGINYAGISLVNARGLERPALFVLAHENAHTLQDQAERGTLPGATQQEKDAAKIWAPMEQAIWDMIPETKRREYAGRFLFKGKDIDAVMADPDKQRVLKREMLADFSGKRLNERETIDELARRAPKEFGNFAKRWIASIDALIKRLRSEKGVSGLRDIDEAITDLQRAKLLWTDAMIAWQRRGGASAAPEMAGTSASASGREAGETDKAFAKRVVDKRPAPADLPERYEDYFLMDGARVVPLSDLVSTKSAEENQQGGDNGPKRMVAAAAGELSKRAPITVMPAKSGGKFEVVDGNGTLTSVGKYGWKALPVMVVSREEGLRLIAEDKAKDAAKEAAKARPSNSAREAMIDGRPYNAKADNFKAPRVVDIFPAPVVSLADELVAKYYADRPPVALAAEDRARAEALLVPMLAAAESQKVVFDQKILDIVERTGAVGQMLAPIKGIKRAAEKLAEEEFKTGEMKDLLRSTIVVNSYPEAVQILAEIRKEFKVMRVKDRSDQNLLAGDDIKVEPRKKFGGYADVMVNVIMPNGTIAEIQINVPAMLAAKGEQGHKLYEAMREQPEGSKMRQRINDAMSGFYDAAFDLAKARQPAAQDRNADSEMGAAPDDGRALRSISSSPESASLKTLPSGNTAYSSPENDAKNLLPGGKLSGIFKASSPVKDPIVNQGSQGRGVEPAPLYLSRKLQNTTELRAWAAGVGIRGLVPADKMHVTIAYSKDPVDSREIGDAPATLVIPTGPRSIERLGEDGDIVLRFEAPELQARWQSLMDSGASWDFGASPGAYKPHITLAYGNQQKIDLASILPFRGPLKLGAEKVEDLKSGWGKSAGTDDTVSNSMRGDFARLKANAKRKAKGKAMADSVAKKLKLSAEQRDSTALDLMTGEVKSEAFLTPKIGALPEVVQFLEDRRLASGLEPIDINTDAGREQLANLMAAEAMAAISAAGNALEWYDATIRTMLDRMSMKFPELRNDEQARTAMLLCIAITSQGQNVETNLSTAIRLYPTYRDTGRFLVDGAGESKSQMEQNFSFLNFLLDDMGPSMLARFLKTPFTVGELKSIGFKVGGELMDETVLGSSVLGPKIGFGFFSNLTGNFEPVTMDMWFMRLVGRLTGKLRSFDSKKFKKQTDNLMAALDEDGADGIYAADLPPEMVAAAREKIEDEDGDMVLNEDAIVALAREVDRRHQREFTKRRAEFDAKTRKKTALVFAAGNIVKSMDKPRDAPASGGERRLLRDVVGRLVDKVAEAHGTRIPPASLQALVWYPEQELYKSLGVKLSVTSQDYAGAALKILAAEGINEQELLSAGRAGPARQDDGRDVGRSAQGAGGPAGRSDALEGRERRDFIHARAITALRRGDGGLVYGQGRGAGPSARLDVAGTKVKPLGEFKLPLKAKNKLQSVGISTPALYEIPASAAADFARAIEGSKEGNKFASSVFVYPVEEYADMRLFVAAGGKTGFALKGDDIVSVFNYDKANPAAVHAMLPLAIQMGGKRLDAFDTVLPMLYGMHGMRAVARTSWNDDYAPDGWRKADYDSFNRGEPDVVFMVHDPKNFEQYGGTEGKRAEDYDAAVALQAAAVDGSSPSFSGRDAEPASRVGMSFKDVTKRTPELQALAKDMQEGRGSREEYAAAVDRFKPVEPYTTVPKPATDAEIRSALTSDKVEKTGIPSSTLKKGDPVALRLDIPAYSNHGTWVVSVHEQQGGFAAGKSIGYEPVARASNVTLGVSSEKAALSIAAGKPKGTIATMKGSWIPTTRMEAGLMARSAMRNPAWRQVGMDPERHSYFYDRATMEPIVAADEVIQIGPLVLAKNATVAPADDFSFSRRAGGWLDDLGRVQFAPGAYLYGKAAPVVNSILAKVDMNPMPRDLKRIVREMKGNVEKAKQTASGVAEEMFKVSEADRKLISDIVEGELKTGFVPPQHALRMADGISRIMDQQTQDLMALGMLSQESADQWRGKYLPRFYESKIRQALDPFVQMVKKMTGKPGVMQGIGGRSLRGRGLWETVPASELANWQSLGWEIRDQDYDPATSTEVQVWRDFTRAERDKMGEIRDAGFRFVMGYMRTQRDIALGRMFQAIAANPELSSKNEKPGWRQVPDGRVEGTGVKRYGKLAGRWVPQEVMSHLGNIDGGHSEAMRLYRQAMSAWKEGKTVLNPVSHANNVMSNVTMAHLAGVSYWDAHKYAGAIMDLAKNRPMVQEARDAGLFMGTMSQEELLQGMPPALRAMAAIQESKTERAAGWIWDALALWLRRPAGAAYEAEDLFFRYAIYRDARQRGLSPQDAVDYSQRYVFTYDDLPGGAQKIRDFAIPFFAYTYKFIPAFLHTAAHYPHRLLAPAALMGGLNAAMYALAAGDDGEDWDEKIKQYLGSPERREKARAMEAGERENLPPWMKGWSLMGAPKAVRLGMDDVTGLPLFWDIGQIMPGGNMFDIHSNSGGVPWFQSLTPSHPLLTVYTAMVMNKDSFFGRDLVDENDTRGEAAAKRAEWMWRQITPAIAVGNYHSTRLANVVAQITGEPVRWIWSDATGFGKDGLPVQPGLSAIQTVGIKIRPVDLDMSAQINESTRKRMISDIDAEMRRLQRLHGKGAISDRQLEAERDLAQTKKQRLREGLTVDGEEIK